MLVLLGIGFLAGIVTAISPCVLPVLPILLAGGASGRKPLRIVTGLIGSFVVFTLSATWLLGKLGLPDDLLRNLAIGLLFALAATLIVPQLGVLLERPFAGLTRHRAGGGGFMLGISLGLVFVPCAGPVLAAVTAAAASNHVGLRAILLTVAYALGAALPMLLIAFGGRGMATRLRAEVPKLRIGSGIVIGLVALAISLNLDSRFQTALPGYTQALQKHIEDSSTARRQLGKVNGAQAPVAVSQGGGGSSLPNYGPAGELVAGGRWFNSEPLTLSSLRGKVVLVDFWTYSCVNCLRTLPHIKSWYSAYHKDGLVIVGVHSPEFAFEHVAANVQAAIRRLGITYPVVQDNNYATWNNFRNEYWPAEYLIDRQGRIRAYDFGEGGYDTMETNIQTLLGVDTSAKSVPDVTPTESITPESYLGYGRIEPTRYIGSKLVHDAPATYTSPLSVPANDYAYSGSWTVGAQRIVAGKDAALTLHFRAEDIYLVLGGHGTVKVSIPGRPARNVAVDSYKLYTLRSSHALEDALLHLSFTPGVQAYAFTFG